jgi:hypothetical protein
LISTNNQAPAFAEAATRRHQGGGKFFRELEAPQLCCGGLHLELACLPVDKEFGDWNLSMMDGITFFRRDE